MGCDAAKNNIYSKRFINWCKWLDCNEGKLPRIVSFYIFLTVARLNNLIPDNIMGLNILKQKCACRKSFVKIIWKLLSLKMSK